MSLVYIIEDEPIMADCLTLTVRSIIERGPNGEETHPGTIAFFDAIEAMDAINEELPDVILLDVLLSGPDGFAFLNELVSYHDTAKIPVILISSLDLSDRKLDHYGVVQVLNKATMTPEDIQAAVITALNQRDAKLKTTAEQEVAPTNPHLANTGIAALNQQLASGQPIEGEIVEEAAPLDVPHED